MAGVVEHLLQARHTTRSLVSHSERLTRIGCYIVYQGSGTEPKLQTSTEAQDALRIMDDRPLPWRLLTGCRNGLEETRFGGFFVASQKRLVDSDASWVSASGRLLPAARGRSRPKADVR
jgi:hypothetical protein